MSLDARCFVCSGKAFSVKERAELRIGNRNAFVDVERLRCGECGESFFTPAQAEAAQRAAADELRRQDGLLTPGEIRSIRAKYGLTQVQLEQLLRVGAKTVVRWERGTVFQNKATDMLLRVLRDVPAAFAFLAKANGPIGDTNSVVSFGAPSNKVSYTSVQGAGKQATRVARVLSFPNEPPMTRVQVAEEVELPEIPQEALK